jgi:hypothetical protein
MSKKYETKKSFYIYELGRISKFGNATKYNGFSVSKLANVERNNRVAASTCTTIKIMIQT